MHCNAVVVALLVACAASSAAAQTYSSPLSGTVAVCQPGGACVVKGPWVGYVTVTTNEGGDGLYSGPDLQSIAVSSYAYAGPGVTLADFYSDGFGVGADGSASAWPTVTIRNGQISDIEESYSGGAGDWDFSGGYVSWTSAGGFLFASAGIGAVPEASGPAMLLLGLAALALRRRSNGAASCVSPVSAC